MSQNETGGKDLLLKIEKDLSASVASGSSVITGALHGLAVGDLIEVDSPGTVSELTAGQFYFVVSVPTVNTFTVATRPSGSAISFGHTSALALSTYLALGGLRAKSIALTIGGVKATNHDSNQWETMLDGAGISKVAISGSGVYTNVAAFQLVETQAIARALTKFAFIDVKNFKIVYGQFLINSLDESGSYDGDGQYSMKCESSGAVTILQMP